MNLDRRTTIAVISSLRFVELKLDDIKYEMHEIIIHEFLDMPGISTVSTVALARITESKEFNVTTQPIEPGKKYIVALASDGRGLLYTMYYDFSKLIEATSINIAKYKEIANDLDKLIYGKEDENT